jgi:hypothetical protein
MRFIKASLLLVLAACPDRPIASVYPEQGTVEQKDISVTDHDVDILFLVDNSGSMEAEQASLRANFPRFMNILQTIEGGAPNMHIGVATSNLGQSANDGVGMASFGASCANKGDDGAMRTASMISGRFIIDEDQGGTRNHNYTGTLEDAFSAIANVGITGCGIEQHLGAVKRALENPTNTGFLRPDAKLAVIVIADEDDCSLSHKALFEGSTDGTVVNFRCTQSGVECDDDPTLSIPGEHTGCHPKDPSPLLSGVQTYIDYQRSLKANPHKDVIVGGIVGNPKKFKITTDHLLGPACEYGDQTAFPAIRTASFLKGFPQSVEGSICGADLQEPLVEIAEMMRRSWGDPCFDGTVIDFDPDAEGVQADCSVTDMQGDNELAVLPNCSSGRIPCWRIEIDNEHCGHTPAHQKLVIDRGSVVPPVGTHVKVNCVTEQNAGQVQ